MNAATAAMNSPCSFAVEYRVIKLGFFFFLSQVSVISMPNPALPAQLKAKGVKSTRDFQALCCIFKTNSTNVQMCGKFIYFTNIVTMYKQPKYLVAQGSGHNHFISLVYIIIKPIVYHFQPCKVSSLENRVSAHQPTSTHEVWMKQR